MVEILEPGILKMVHTYLISEYIHVILQGRADLVSGGSVLVIRGLAMQVIEEDSHHKGIYL